MKRIILFLVCLVSLVCAQELSPPTSLRTGGLVGYWKMDYLVSGTNVWDSSGRGNSGTLSGGMTSANLSDNAHQGKCLTFDGVDDYVDFGDVTVLDGAVAVSFTFWVKYNNLVSGGGLLSKWGNLPVDRQILVLEDTTSDEILVALFDGVANLQLKTTSAANLATGVWYHIAVTFENNTDLKVYVNGVQQSLTTVLNDSVAALSSTSTTSFQIGAETDELRPSLDGRLDQVQIWNRALSAGEINILYHQ